MQTYGDPAQHQVHDARAAGRRRNRRRPQRRRREGRPRRSQTANLAKFDDRRTRDRRPAVGHELRTQGHLGDRAVARRHPAYIAFRYQFSFALGAVVATIHDLLVTLAFLAFFQYDMTLNVIAALLTVTGYSTNDTIVIFDRVRENLRGMRRDSLDDVINCRSTRRSAGRSSRPARRC